ncbi:Kelch repeat-containing protein, partial [Planctomycetota bacterium]
TVFCLLSTGCLGPLYGVYELTKEKPTDKNRPPVIVLTDPGRSYDASAIPVIYKVSDPDRDGCSVLVSYNDDLDENWDACTTLTSPIPYPLDLSKLVIYWDAVTDLGAVPATKLDMQVAVRAYDGEDLSLRAESLPFTAGNEAPVVTITPPADGSGNIVIDYTLEDEASDVCEVLVEFSISGSGSWDPCVPASVVAVNPQIGLLSLPAIAGGMGHSFTWSTDDDLPGADETVSIRITATDGEPLIGQQTTADFYVTNNSKPELAVGAALPSQDGLVYVPYDCTDAENNTVSVLAEYQEFGSGIWKQAALGPGTSFLTDGTPRSGCVAWDSLRDGVRDTNVLFRLTPSETSTLGAGAQTTFHVGNLASNEWNHLVDLPFGRSHSGAAVVDGKLYIIGGKTDTMVRTNRVDMYDPSLNTWTTKASIPVQLSEMGCAVYNGKIYVFGGRVPPIQDTTTACRVYDPAADAWSSRAPMVNKRSGVAVALAGGKMYVMGGYTQDSPLYSPANEEYDPEADTWTARANMPNPRADVAGAAVGGKVYVVGGRIGNTYYTYCQRYDPATNTWANMAAMPKNRATAVTAVGNRLFAVGGTDDNYLAHVQEYDIPTNAWTSRTPLPSGRQAPAVTTLGGKIYTAGGYYYLGQGVYMKDLDVYDPGQAGSGWSAIAGMAVGKCNPKGAVYDGKIYAMGGRQSSTYYNRNDRYDPATNTWTVRAGMPGVREGLECVTLGDRIYAMGGNYYSGTSYYCNNMWAYNPIGNSWATLAPMPRNRTNFGAAVLDGKIYCIGGYTGPGTWTAAVDVFDPVAGTWSSAAPLPSPRYNMGCESTNGRIYIIGGSYNWTEQKTVYEYDPGTDSWATKTPMENARSTVNTVAVGSRIYVVGGNYGIDYTEDVDEYDVKGDKWTAMTPMNNERIDPALAAVGNVIYACGGYDDSDTGTATAERMKAFSSLALVRDIPEIPGPAAAAGSFCLDGRVYRVGGRDSAASALAATTSFECVTDIDSGPFEIEAPWVAVMDLPAVAGRRAAGVAACGGLGYLAGGFDNTDTPQPDLFFYDPGTEVWTPLPSMPTARGGLALIAIDDKLYAIGGELAGGTKTGIVEIYDTVGQTWTAGASMANSRSHFGCARDSRTGLVYAIGGDNGAGPITSIEAYNAGTNTWAANSFSLPDALAGLLCLAEEGKLKLFGGENAAGLYMSQILIVDIQGGTVVNDSAMLPYAARDLWGCAATLTRDHRGQAQIGEFCLLGGGYDGTTHRDGFFRYYSR